MNKNMLRKIVGGFALIAVAAIATAQASGLFSHAVLNLPHDLRSEEAWGRLVSTQREWETFYKDLFSGNPLDLSSIPQIDFELYHVVAGGLGMKPNGGYSLTVANVFELEDAISVHVLIVAPGDNCFVTTAIDYPSTAILVPKTNKPFHFFFSNLVNQCLE